MVRVDIAPYLVHFTKGEGLEDAFRRLQAIVAQRTLLGTCTHIRGGYGCICFSEAPLSVLSGGLVNESYYSRYSPFGVMVSKEWLFAKGGRPVIYQTEEEFLALPEVLRWRHVRYDIGNEMERIDFTWEREWRIRAESLEFDPAAARLVVLDAMWACRLQQEHEKETDERVRQYAALVFPQQIAELYREPFPWTVLTLR